MPELVLGIDTSNYTSSAAVTDARTGNILADVRIPLKVKSGGRGLRQSDALYQHWHNLPSMLEGLLSEFGKHIAAVAASERPRPEPGSYMPVFGAGSGAARMLAAALRAPLIMCSHQDGHIWAAARGRDIELSDPQRPVLCAHLSGGTLELVLKKGETTRIVGGTRDISYGQLFDRIGVDLGFDFPAGRRMDELACSFDPKGAKNPLSEVFCSGAYLNLSGLETQLREAESSLEAPKLAWCMMERVCGSFVRIAEAALRECGAGILLVTGGAACSLYMRRYCEGRGYVFGDIELCSDNAVGVSLYGGAFI